MGIIHTIFSKLLIWKLKRDPDFMASVAKADKSMESLREKLIQMEKRGVPVAPSLKKFAGMEVIDAR